MTELNELPFIPPLSWERHEDGPVVYWTDGENIVIFTTVDEVKRLDWMEDA